jgi:hypothetical protein
MTTHRSSKEPVKEFRGEALRWEWRDGVVELTLDREPLNEIGTVMLADLEKFVGAFKNLAPITSACIVTSARPGGFCAGADLRELYVGAVDLPKAKRLAGRLLEVQDELLVGGPGGGIAHLLDRPGQVDGGGAGGGQAVAGLVKVIASSPGGDGGAVGRGHADRGCAAHDHGADRLDHLGPVVVAVLTALARQQGLVEQHQTAVLEPDDRAAAVGAVDPGAAADGDASVLDLGQDRRDMRMCVVARGDEKGSATKRRGLVSPSVASGSSRSYRRPAQLIPNCLANVRYRTLTRAP